MEPDEMPTSIDLAIAADFRLGNLCIRPSSREVLADGDLQVIEPRVMQVLVSLARLRGQVVSRDRLIQECWAGRVVGEDAINRCIARIRRLAKAHMAFRIETIARVGYRLSEDGQDNKLTTESAPTTASEDAAAPLAPRSSADSPSADIHAADQPPADRPPISAPLPPSSHSHTSIAILPFRNLTGDPVHDDLSEGVTDQLIATLARIPTQLRVPARASVFAYQGKNIDVRQIARELGVDFVVEGSLSRAGQQIRVAVQLIDGRSGYHIWSRTLDGSPGDPLDFRDAVTIWIADALNPGGAGPLTSARKPPTRDLQAYQLFLQAKSLAAQPTEHNLHNALELMREALARDPAFARAWQALAAILGHDFLTMDYSMPTATSDAEHDARQALLLDPSLPGAHAVLGLIYASRGRWIAAEQWLSIALSLLPGDPEFRIVHSIYWSQSAGHLHAALKESEAASKGVPLISHFTFDVGVAKLLSGHTADALAWIETAIVRGLPRNAGAVPDMLALAAMRQHRYQDAFQHMSTGLRPAWRSAGGIEAANLFYAALRDNSYVQSATDVLQTLEEIAGVDALDQWSGKRLMLWYTLLGALDCAYASAHRLLDQLAAFDSIGIGWGLLWIPELRPFRCDPRFQAFAERLGLIEYWLQYGPPDGCELCDGRLVCS